jgi:hypothetical protein
VTKHCPSANTWMSGASVLKPNSVLVNNNL